METLDQAVYRRLMYNITVSGQNPSVVRARHRAVCSKADRLLGEIGPWYPNSSAPLLPGEPNPVRRRRQEHHVCDGRWGVHPGRTCTYWTVRLSGRQEQHSFC